MKCQNNSEEEKKNNGDKDKNRGNCRRWAPRQAEWCRLITETLPSWGPGAVIEFSHIPSMCLCLCGGRSEDVGECPRDSQRTDRRTWCWQLQWITACLPAWTLPAAHFLSPCLWSHVSRSQPTCLSEVVIKDGMSQQRSPVSTVSTRWYCYL